MVSTRGNPVADGRKSTLPSRESRRSTRGALQEPEDEVGTKSLSLPHERLPCSSQPRNKGLLWAASALFWTSDLDLERPFDLEWSGRVEGPPWHTSYSRSSLSLVFLSIAPLTLTGHHPHLSSSSFPPSTFVLCHFTHHRTRSPSRLPRPLSASPPPPPSFPSGVGGPSGGRAEAFRDLRGGHRARTWGQMLEEMVIPGRRQSGSRPSCSSLYLSSGFSLSFVSCLIRSLFVFIVFSVCWGLIARKWMSSYIWMSFAPWLM